MLAFWLDSLVQKTTGQVGAMLANMCNAPLWIEHGSLQLEFEGMDTPVNRSDLETK